jgi:hypothetical protein
VCSTSSFRFFEKYPAGISVSKTTSLIQPMDMGIIKKLKKLHKAGKIHS